MTEYEMVTVWVPLGELAERIDAGSGVVGRRVNPRSREVYFEGNRYGYVNVKTYADRVEVARGRMEQRYPTVARAIAPNDQLARVGWFHVTDQRVHVTDEKTLAEWLGIATGELEAELRCT